MARRWTCIIGLALVLSSGSMMNAEDKITTTGGKFPAIPEEVTSFGAAIAGDSLYFYGGHTGDAHSYANKEQGRQLWQVDLKAPKQWKSLASGPPVQGLALIAYDGKLYRIGGFTAKNKAGEEHDLWSQSSVACFDPAAGEWTECPPLPQPRSSFDAAVLDGHIYVIGGWKLAGEEGNSQWHSTAYVLDVTAEPKTWIELPKPPFQRRALAVAAHNGKIYAIGGMKKRGGPTTRVDIYDPKTKQWTTGPSIEGQGMTGFGASAFATGGRLYVSTIDGSLQQLSEDGKSWKTIGKLDNARFFHRMLPLNDRSLLMIGGASMSSGKYDDIDIIGIR